MFVLHSQDLVLTSKHKVKQQTSEQQTILEVSVSLLKGQNRLALFMTLVLVNSSQQVHQRSSSFSGSRCQLAGLFRAKDQLDYIQGMGFDCIWITPVVKAMDYTGRLEDGRPSES